jgi:chromosomal replication initiator protein
MIYVDLNVLYGIASYRYNAWVPSTLSRLLSLPENRSGLAAVARIVASLAAQQNRLPNPLFLHGPPGAGKTTLISHLVDEASRKAPRLVISVLRAGDLIKQAETPADDQATSGLDGFDHADLVIVEDLQHLPVRLAEPFVQVFEKLLAHQVPMVFTASTGPQRLNLSARIKSRLAGGLVVAVEPLRESSRLALLVDKAQRRQIAVSQEVLVFLARQLRSGREIDGALIRLEALARNRRQPVDLATVYDRFKEQDQTQHPFVERIARCVGGYFQVEPRQLQSGRRSRHILLPRQVGMYLARRLTRLSLQQIGAYFGGRDHSTVLHACRKVEQALRGDPRLSGAVQQIQAGLM